MVLKRSGGQCDTGRCGTHCMFHVTKRVLLEGRAKDRVCFFFDPIFFVCVFQRDNIKFLEILGAFFH